VRPAPRIKNHRGTSPEAPRCIVSRQTAQKGRTRKDQIKLRPSSNSWKKKKTRARVLMRTGRTVRAIQKKGKKTPRNGRLWKKNRQHSERERPAREHLPLAKWKQLRRRKMVEEKVSRRSGAPTLRPQETPRNCPQRPSNKSTSQAGGKM